jgi:anti-anti-sigma factor
MTFEVVGDVVVISVIGRVAHDQLGRIDEAFVRLRKQGYRKFVGDCSRAEHLTSTGVGLLIYHLPQVRGEGGRLVLVRPPQSVTSHLEPLRLEAFAPVCATRAEALELLRRDG